MSDPTRPYDRHFDHPSRFSADEWAARVQLAAAYRIFDHMGWSELIYNHISLRVPGPERHFLINPFGLHYSEVRASNLVKVDIEGNIVGHSDWPINPAGFTFHGAIHRARPVRILPLARFLFARVSATVIEMSPCGARIA